MTTTIHRETDPFRLDEPLIALVAAGGPMAPPADWFKPPEMLRATPIQVLANGRVYGHIAAWAGTPHIGLPNNTRPPKSRSNYAYFRTGVVATADRPDVTDGQIRALRASAPSGDWRVINGGHELVAICQVNAPGFPIPRAECMVAGGAVTALVAAGAQHMFMLRMADALLPEHITAAVDARVEHLLAKRDLRARFQR
jgi:hypothetical protein